MDEETPEGVEAFARYFVAVAERAWNTGDTTELETISSRECTYCSNLTTLIHEKYDAGYWVDGLEYQIVDVEEPIAYPQDTPKYAVFIHLQTSGTAYSDGEQVQSVSDSSQMLELQACSPGKRWVACGGIGTSDDS